MGSGESTGEKTRNVKEGIHTGRLAVFYRNDPTCSRGLLKPSRLFSHSRSHSRACSTCFMYSHRRPRTSRPDDVRKRVYLRFMSPPHVSLISLAQSFARSVARSPFALLCRMFDLLSSTCYSPLCRTFRLLSASCY